MAHYPAGTLYSNSEIYDEATDRANEFGDTIFMQKRPDGTPTGRESVVIGGRLVGLGSAEHIHKRNIEEAAPDLLAALETALRHAREALPADQRAEFDAGQRGPEWMFIAKSAIAKARR